MDFFFKLKPYLQPENDIAYFIVWAQIILTGLWFICWLIFRFWYLRRRINEIEESQNVAALRRVLFDELKSNSETPSDLEGKKRKLSPTTVFEGFWALVSTAKKSPIEDHLRAIFFAGYERRDIDAEALTKITANRVLRFQPIFRSILSLFIILGLFGTLFGLASSLAQLAPITNQSLQTGNAIVGDSLQNLLEQLKSAFAPSIWGVLFTVIGVSVFATFSYRAAYFRYLLEFTTTTIWIPLLTPPTVDTLTQTLLENEAQLRRNLETAEKNIKTAAELAKYVDSIQNNIKEFQSSFTDAKETLNKFTGAANKLTSVSEKFEKASTNVGNFEERLSALYNQLQQGSKAFQNYVRTSIDETKTAQKEQGEVLKSENRSLTEVLEKIKAFEEKHRESNTTLNNNLMSLSEELKELSAQAKTSFDNLSERNKEIAENLAKEVGEPLQAQLKDSLVELTSKLETTSENIGRVETTLAVKLRDIVNWTQNLEKPFTSVADQLGKSFANFDNRTIQLTTDVKNEFIKINKFHEDQLNALTLLNPEIGNLLKKLSESGTSYADQGKELTKLIGVLASSIVSLSNQVGDLGQKIDRVSEQGFNSGRNNRTHGAQHSEPIIIDSPKHTRWQRFKNKIPIIGK